MRRRVGIEKHFGKTRGAKLLREIRRAFSYSEIRRKRTVSKNLVYLCRRGSEQFVLKKYVPRKGLEKEFKKRALNEINTYISLEDELSLPKVAAYNAHETYLVMKKEPLRKVKSLSAKTARDAALLLAKIHSMPAPNHPHLFKYGFSYYHNTLHHMLRNLQAKGVLTPHEANAVDKLLEGSRRDITGAEETFVHGDYHLENLFYDKNRLIPLDFEYSGIGSPAYDLAVFLFPTAKGRNKELFLKEYLAKRKLKNFKRLFEVMLLRRCIELLHAFAGNRKARQYKSAAGKLRAMLAAKSANGLKDGE
ncbi:MAG: aminoglycoside phosphotransferase family protein [Candidatus Micrarchaeia archaeon]